MSSLDYLANYFSKNILANDVPITDLTYYMQQYAYNYAYGLFISYDGGRLYDVYGFNDQYNIYEINEFLKEQYIDGYITLNEIRNRVLTYGYKLDDFPELLIKDGPKTDNILYELYLALLDYSTIIYQDIQLYDISKYAYSPEFRYNMWLSYNGETYTMFGTNDELLVDNIISLILSNYENGTLTFDALNQCVRIDGFIIPSLEVLTSYKSLY
jgi:hypothetical protein